MADADSPTGAYDGDPAPSPDQGDSDIDMQHYALEQHNNTLQGTPVNDLDVNFPQNTSNINQSHDRINNPPSFNHFLAPAHQSVTPMPAVANNASPHVGFNPGFQLPFQPSSTPIGTPVPFGHGLLPPQTPEVKIMPPSRLGTPMSQHQTPIVQYQPIQYFQHQRNMTQYTGGYGQAQAPQYLPQPRPQTAAAIHQLQRPAINFADEQMRVHHHAERLALLDRQAAQYQVAQQQEVWAEPFPGYRPRPPPPAINQARPQPNNHNPQAFERYHVDQQPPLMPTYPRIPLQPMPTNNIKLEGTGTAQGRSDGPSLVPKRKIPRQSSAASTPNVPTPRAMPVAPQPQRVLAPQPTNDMLRQTTTAPNPPAMNGNPAADLAAHQLVQAFVNRHQNNPLAVDTFYRLAANFNNHIINENQFYVDVYKLFYMLGSNDFLIQLYHQRPFTWRNTPLQWFHQAIQHECDDQVLEVMAKRIMRTGRVELLMGGPEGTAPPSTPFQAAVPSAPGQQQAVETKIVNLKLSRSALQNIRQSGLTTPVAPPAPDNDANDTAIHLVADFAGVNAGDGAADRWDNNDFLEESVPLKKTKKKVPMKGYRAGQGDVDPNADTSSTKRRSSRQTHVALTVPQAEQETSSPQVGTPAQDSAIEVDEGDENGDSEDEDDGDGSDDGDFDGPTRQTSKNSRSIGPKVRAKRAISRDTAKLPGSEVPHVGKIYPTRRAILARDDKPYIHNACAQGFKHPDDVRKHHNQNCDSAKGLQGEKKPLWNDHASCKIQLSQLEYCKVEDGFVVLDQDSLDKVQECVDEGRAVNNLQKASKRAAKATGLKVGDKKFDEEIERVDSALAEGNGNQMFDNDDVGLAQPVADSAAAYNQAISTNPFTVNPLMANPFATGALMTKPSVVTTPASLTAPATTKKKSTPIKTKTSKTKTPKKTIPSKRGPGENENEDSDYGSANKQASKRQVVKAGPD
ncbi:hypothetical protein LTR78_006874 [Recurvomyces mirabilis]|uniref:Uncharacterized protein n=1 Tax=Recurvomyces mirabilis TaxID=574656 RepID=A0AAE1BZG1_9PEZI|nr:hypothetical protein LTR78_006874 [Recurvomyces mirabilis]KAK5153136.1 hypothetical protein LTS14_007780 [Recurvomyces mirabilis]